MYSGENDVDSSLLCDCRNIDPALEDWFEEQGYDSGGLTAASSATNFTRGEAEQVLIELRKEFREQVDSECEEDCDDLRNAYPWGKLLDYAEERGTPHPREELRPE